MISNPEVEIGNVNGINRMFLESSGRVSLLNFNLEKKN